MVNKAVAWMLGALLSFCLMAVAARELSASLNTFQVLFFRSATGLLVVLLILSFTRRWTEVKTERRFLHISRNVIHLAGQYGWFLAIALLPLAEVFALEFTVPLWTALLAFLLLKEKLTVRKISAIALGFAGVVVIVQPGFESLNHGTMIMLAAAVGYSLAHVATKSLSQTESPLSIIFYMSLIQLPIAGALAASDWLWPQDSQWGWLGIIGVTSLSAHYCISSAMKHADASVVVTMDFLRLPAIAVVGTVAYGEKIEVALIIGALLMLAGNLINTFKPRNAKLSE